MVTGYRQRSLADELQGARDVLDAAGIAFEVTRDSAVPPAPVDSLLAWTVREGVTNILRHSRAHHCEISLSTSNGGFTVAIVDDGVGGVASAGGSGLHGLRERVGAAGGHLEAGPGRAGWLPPAGVRSPGGDVIHVLLAEDQGMVRGALGHPARARRATSRSSPSARAAMRLWPRHWRRTPTLPCSISRCPGSTASRRHRSSIRRCPTARSSSSPRSAGPDTCAAPWRREPPGSSSRTVPPISSPCPSVAPVAGERVIDTALAAAALSDGSNPLTPRERDVLHAASGGATIATIATSMFLSQGTVRNYLSSAIQKTARATVSRPFAQPSSTAGCRSRSRVEST